MATNTTVEAVAPTGPSLLRAVNNNLLHAIRQGQSGTVSLPSLRERAKLIVKQETLLIMENKF